MSLHLREIFLSSHFRSRQILLFFLLLVVVAFWLARNQILAIVQEKGSDSAERLLDEGIEANKRGQYDYAMELFRRAWDQNPRDPGTRLSLLTLLSGPDKSGRISEEGRRFALLAVSDFHKVLEKDPSNLSAIDGIAAIFFQLGNLPFDAKKCEESREYHKMHIRLKPTDAEPYYWVGVINWTLAYHENKAIRSQLNSAGQRLTETDALPQIFRKRFRMTYGAVVEEGIQSLEKAIALDPQYRNAIAYLSLNIRLKADQSRSREECKKLLAKADALADQVRRMKLEKQQISP